MGDMLPARSCARIGLMELPELAERLKSVPQEPGVYILKDGAGTIIYVGKASSLRNRLRSYFAFPDSPKLILIQRRLADFELIITASEQEALILEANFIKKHHPRFNVRLRDDKNYPYLRISVQEDYPRVSVVRRPQADGARYFGPYASAHSVRATIDLTKKLFPYCNCTLNFQSKHPRACLDYYLGRCLGPCIGAVTPQEYHPTIDQLILFLEGRQEEVARRLRADMEAAAKALDFEKAARRRDQVRAIERLMEEQKVTSAARGDLDVIAIAQERTEACALVFFIRHGKLTGQEHFALEMADEEAPAELMRSFLTQYYGAATIVPPEVLLAGPVGDQALVRSWLSEKRGRPVRLATPARGEKYRLAQMAAKNAAELLEQIRARWLADFGKTSAALAALQQEMGLPRLPQRIEGYDISNIMGTSAVGSMVVFEKGKPKSADYRRFRIKTVPGADDYAMLQEVLRRRFRRTQTAASSGEPHSKPADDKWATLPDLVLIDGGKGQLSAALEAMTEVGVAEMVSTASLAKEREEVFLPGQSEPLRLPGTSPALYLLQRVRDESHRFALAYHLKVRQKRALTSALDQIAGVGPRRKAALLRRFGSLQGIKEAPLDEVAAVPGMTRRLAEQVKSQL